MNVKDEWKEGYTAGFSDGYNKALKELGDTKMVPYKPSLNDWLTAKSAGTTCSVCGMFFERGKTYGYVCGHSHCPGKITCSTGQPYNVLWSSAMAASVIKDPGPSDGMSYEEIYGSVIYQQNNKKEE